MSWDIMLFKTNKQVNVVENINDDYLELTDFGSALENHFENIYQDKNYREIKGKDFTIEFFIDDTPKNNFLLQLKGEKGLFEIIQLAKLKGWQIFDTMLGEMIDIENPVNNGFSNYKKYVKQITKNEV